MDFELFRDRRDAGRRLAEHLIEYQGKDAIVLAIPRGGVPVGYEIALRLGADFDVIIPRKIPIPWNPEAGMGAITDDGTMVLNESMIKSLRLSREEIERHAEEVRQEILRRISIYRPPEVKPPSVTNRPVILVDDGLASGYTMLAAIESVKKEQPSAIVVAVPVASSGAVRLISQKADKLVALIVSERLPFAVADYYLEWRDLTDEEVVGYLNSLRQSREQAA
jgi:putative phosphoribosyl transferase